MEVGKRGDIAMLNADFSTDAIHRYTICVDIHTESTWIRGTTIAGNEKATSMSSTYIGETTNAFNPKAFSVIGNCILLDYINFIKWIN